MATLLQLHFSFNGPFGDAMAEQLKPLAESINQEPGFMWKVWTESEKNHEVRCTGNSGHYHLFFFQAA
ncbi:hypothetical protein UL79_19725, partial [Shigella dysenteriae]|uniref:YdhR family protein n=2 Tax=Shigella dysenteriae TaxID=622 RepID=UPI000E5C5F66